MKIVSCKNCRTRFFGRYCPHCGQSASVGRLNWKTLRSGIVSAFTNTDKGFLFTVRELCLRPGHMMRDYLTGKRIDFFRPFSLLVIVSGAYVLLSTHVFPKPDGSDAPPKSRTETIDRSVPATAKKKAVRSSGTPKNGKDDHAVSDRLEKEIRETLSAGLLKKATDNPVSISLLLIFSIAWVAPWVFRREGGRKYTYVEYLFIGTYMSSQRFLFDIATLPYEYFTAGYGWFIGRGLLTFVGYIGLTSWNHKQLFDMRWGGAVLKTIVLMIVSFFAAVLLGALLLAVVMTIATGVTLAF